MLKNKLLLYLAVSSIFCLNAFAQDGYEADTDSAWIASQNGGSTEINDGNDEPNASCIGDGCDGTESVESSTNESSAVTDNINENSPADSTAKPGSVASADSSDMEDCTAADSLVAECQDDEEEQDTYERYIQENAEQYRARKEGFSRSIKLGARIAGGMNMIFGKKADDWNPSFEGTVGIFARMPVGLRTLRLTTGLDFDYRKYDFETSSDYSEDEASIDMLLFEIPVIFQYMPEDEGFFVGLGFDLGLKLGSTSEYKQEVDTGKEIEKDKRKNTLPTSAVELGGIFNVGYAITQWFVVDIRVVQCFTNLLNADAVAESSVMGSKLYTFHTTLGFAFQF